MTAITLRRAAIPLALLVAGGGAYATRRRWAPELSARWRALSPRETLPLRDAPAALERTPREPSPGTDRPAYSPYWGHGYVHEHHSWYHPGWYSAPPPSSPAPAEHPPGPAASVTVKPPVVDPPRLPPGRLQLLERPERGRPKHALEGGAP